MTELILHLFRAGDGVGHLFLQAFLETGPEPVDRDLDGALGGTELPADGLVADVAAAAPEQAPQR